MERCSSWNRMVVASQGGGAYTSAEGAALRVAGFVRPNSTVVDIGGHLGRFSEAIIALGALPLTTLIFEPVRVLHLCQIQRLGNVSNNFGSPQYNFFNFALGNVDNKVESIKTADYFVEIKTRGVGEIVIPGSSMPCSNRSACALLYSER